MDFERVIAFSSQGRVFVIALEVLQISSVLYDQVFEVVIRAGLYFQLARNFQMHFRWDFSGNFLKFVTSFYEIVSEVSAPFFVFCNLGSKIVGKKFKAQPRKRN